MQTTTVARPARVRAPGAHDRAFYSGMAIAMALTVFVGFAPTFYLRSLFGAPVSVTGATTLTPLTQIHGAVFTAWVVLFIVQTALVASRRVAVHRRMGVAGAVLAAAMIALGIATAVAAARRGSAAPGMEPLAFLVIPVFDLVLFAGFVTAALLSRRNRETHKRLMLLAYVSIIVAAFGRFPGIIAFGPPAVMVLSLLPVVAGMIYDFVSRGRVHRVYIWGGALVALSFPGRLALASTPAWHAFAKWLVR
jgi:hypothetical protein